MVLLILPLYMFAHYLKTERDRTQKCFAFSHTRLMYNDGTTLQDGTHELLVYKVREDALVTKVLRFFFFIHSSLFVNSPCTVPEFLELL